MKNKQTIIALNGFQSLIFFFFVLSITKEFTAFGLNDDGDLIFDHVLLLIMGFYLLAREEIIFSNNLE